MNSTNEFAEQYTKKERLRFVLVGLIVGSAFMLGWEAWVLPRWTEFVRTSPCHEFAGVSGVTLVFYSLFVGLPLSSALLVAAVTTRRGLKILRDRQDPYKGEKVLRPTRIKRGPAAVRSGWINIVVPFVFVAIAGWGAAEARKLSSGFDATKFDYSQCKDEPLN